MNDTRTHDNKEILERMIDTLGWGFVVGILMDLAFERDLPELYRELDNLAVNHLPEVK